MKIKPNQNADNVPPIPAMSKTRIIKNVVVLSTGVMVLFIAYDGLTMLQSTMNSDQGIGVISQAVLYLCFCGSALVFPKYVIKKLGSKLTLVLSMVSYIPYVGSNFYPHWSVMMPTSVLLGLGAALLWGSQANYLNDVSVLYADLLLASGKDSEVEIGNGKKERSQSSNGCRCISCVYVEYDGSDSCSLEDQLKEGHAETKPSQESVISLPNNLDNSLFGHPLSSSECRTSCKMENLKKLDPKDLIQNIKEDVKEDSDLDQMAGEKGNRKSNRNFSLNSNGEITKNNRELNTLGSNHKFKEQRLDEEKNDPNRSPLSSKPEANLESQSFCNADLSNSHISKSYHECCIQENGERISDNDDREPTETKPKVKNQSPCNAGNASDQIYNNFIPNNRKEDLESADCSSIQNQSISTKPKTDSDCRLPCKIENRINQNRNNSISKNSTDHSDTAEDKSEPNKNILSKQKEIRTNRSRAIESTTAHFFGFHGLAFLSSSVWSNLMSYFVLQGDDASRSPNTTFNVSFGECGADFCGFESAAQQARQMPSDDARYALTGVCVCLGLAAVLFVALFLDPLDDKSEDGEGGFSLRLLTATVRLAKKTELLMLMPLSFYLGMAKGFYTGDFTKAFVSCALGPSHVGLATVCYGASCALCALLSGWAVKKIGRPALFASSALVNASACALLLAWTPDSGRPIVFFVMAAMWGFQVGTVWSQIRAFYGVLFKADEEAAFATFHTWYSLGFCLSFAYSNFLCTQVKIYVLLAVSTVGYAGYFAVERRHASNTREQLTLYVR